MDIYAVVLGRFGIATTNEPLGGANAHLTNLQKSDPVYIGPNYAFLQGN